MIELVFSSTLSSDRPPFQPLPSPAPNLPRQFDMPKSPKQAALKDLRRIPGVGPRMAEDLWRLGCRRVEDLRARDPEELYRQLCLLEGVTVDRCVLYVFRCAVYFAAHDQHDPELLKWWNWKDRQYAAG